MIEPDLDKLWFLLDTNIVSHLVREPRGVIRDRIAEVGEHTVCINVLVAAELRAAAAKRKSARLQRQLEAILSALPILPLEAPVDVHYAELRAQLAKANRPIATNGLIIAAHAQSLGLILVTRNATELSGVTGLDVENWLS